jgi:polyphosphate kinase
MQRRKWGLSERIRVRSIVGRFLEHSRIFCFGNGGKEEIYGGSADWMPRNLLERCEVLFPVTQADLHKRLRDEILAAYLADNTKARLLQPDGEYVRAPHVGEPFSAQAHLMRLAEGVDEKVAGSIAFPPAPVTIQPSAKGKNGTKATVAARESAPTGS